MKKLFSYLFPVIAGVMLAVSCNKENFEAPDGGEAEVTFTVGTENGMTVKGVSDTHKGATRLIYAVFDANGSLVADSRTVVDDFQSGDNVKIRLVKDKTYQIVFWAQNPGCGAYTLDDDMVLSIDYDGAKNNDLSFDAFCCTETVRIKGNQAVPVTLKRPFAQINIGTTLDDYAAAESHGSFFKASEITVSNAATRLDLLTGSVSGPEEVRFVTNDVLDENVKVGGIDHRYLSMCYILAHDSTEGGSECAIINNVRAKFYATNGESVSIDGIYNVPVQRNYRTNIYGEILMGSADVKVNLDGTFNDEDLYKVIDETTPAQTIQEMVEAGGVVTVAAAGTEEGVDLSGTVAKDLYLKLDGEVRGGITIGGNEPLVKAAVYPDITIEIGKDVPYPAFTFAGKAVNVTIKGDKDTAEKLSGLLEADKGAENLKFDGIVADGDSYIYVNGGSNVSVTNCVGTNLTRTFIKFNAVTDAVIRNNSLAYVPTSETNDGFKHGVEIYWPYGKLVVEGNAVENANKHGIMLNHADDTEVIIKGNTVTGAFEDAVKIDCSENLAITNNTLSAKEYCIRMTRFNNPVTAVVTGNTIDMKDTKKDFYGITVGDDNQTAQQEISLVAKNNTLVNHNDNRGFLLHDSMTASGDYEMPYNVADGVGLTFDGAFGITNTTGLYWFADQVNTVGNTFSKRTVRLTDNIDLSEKNWVPVGPTVAKSFKGTFDGGRHTISGMSAVNNNSYGNGFFRIMIGATVKDVTFDGAKVQRYETATQSGNAYGIVTGYTYGTATFENVHIKNSSLTGFGKVGSLIGLSEDNNRVVTYIRNCSVSNTRIEATYNVAGLIGLALHPVEIENCNVDAEWIRSTVSTHVYLEVDTTVADDPTVEVKGLYWNDSTDKWYYAAWSEYYNDQMYSGKYFSDPADGKIADGLCHN